MPIHYHEQNRQSWNAATQRHHSHKPDLIARYQNGYNNLHEDDMRLLGDLRGKQVAHLQCNDGQDTISIAAFLGATITGIDISDEAIQFAQQLSAQTAIPAEFVRSDLFDWFQHNPGQFDVAYTSYGTYNWLSDLTQWAQGIYNVLKPGGHFVMIDFHPAVSMLEKDWTLAYDYMGGAEIETGGVGDYVGNDYEGNFKNPHTAYEFAWGLGDLIGAVLGAGFTLQAFEEYPYLNGWQRFPEMRAEGRKFYSPPDKPTVAMMFSIVAHKAGTTTHE
jgi:SAM-dependent methyltransferase